MDTVSIQFADIPNTTSANDNPNGVIRLHEKPPVESKRKVAIVGTAESINEAPYDQPDWEIWGLGVDLTYPQFKRWSRLYEMHDKDYWNKPDIIGRLNKANCIVYMQDKYPEIPQSEKFPLEEVTKGYHANYTSSIAFQLAHAAYEARTLKNISHVSLFGVHMMADEEYSHQRPACEYWLGILEALGVEAQVGGAGSILKCAYTYGYDREWKMISDLSIRKQQMQNGLAELERRLEEVKSNYQQQMGAIKDIDWTIRRIQ